MENQAQHDIQRMSVKGLLILYIMLGLSIFVIPVISKVITKDIKILQGAGADLFQAVFCVLFWLLELMLLECLLRKKKGLTLFTEKQQKEELLCKKTLWLLGIVVGCTIFLISIQIGFEVKPFHDMGRAVGFEMYAKMANWLVISMRCFFMVLLIHLGQELAERGKIFKKYKFIWGGILLTLTVGLPDILISMHELTWTYFVINLLFGAIYLLTDRQVAKTYLAVWLIYFF